MGRHLEIERKFLVKSLPAGWKRTAHSRITQGYLPVCVEALEIRLRKRDSKHFLTIKGGRGRKRLEEEIELSQKTFDALWPLTRGARISKTRYQIPFRGKIIQVDVFHGRLRGFVLAEVEFESVRQSRSFQPPDWLGREVTCELQYANETLALIGKPP